ncbi:hypothetical protein L209DRAFT_531169 [Thermothelomyces heterothallicus CBS 203.75]
MVGGGGNLFLAAGKLTHGVITPDQHIRTRVTAASSRTLMVVRYVTTARRRRKKWNGEKEKKKQRRKESSPREGHAQGQATHIRDIPAQRFGKEGLIHHWRFTSFRQKGIASWVFLHLQAGLGSFSSGSGPFSSGSGQVRIRIWALHPIPLFSYFFFCSPPYLHSPLRYSTRPAFSSSCVFPCCCLSIFFMPVKLSGSARLARHILPLARSPSAPFCRPWQCTWTLHVPDWRFSFFFFFLMGFTAVVPGWFSYFISCHRHCGCLLV